MRVMVRLFLISSIYIPRRKSLRGVRPVLYPVCRFTVSALIKRGPQRATVSVTESAQADVAFRLSIAFCLRRAFTGGSDPTIAVSRSRTCNGTHRRCFFNVIKL